LLVQEHLGGNVSDLYSFHGFVDESGRLLGSFVGHKIRTYPDFAGESSFIELADAPEVARHGHDVVSRLGLKGPFKIDVIRDERTGRFVTLEINARFNLWHYLGALHGVNLPAIAYDYLVEHRVPEPPAIPSAPRYRWLNFYRDYLAFREKHARGALGVREWVASIAPGRKLYEAFAWEDPMPFVHWAGAFVLAKVTR
jgi:predicted ATP-grasp superfamily ATP-dependent carboligase